MRDPTDIRAQEREAEDAERQAKFKQDGRVKDLKWLLAHRPGRRIAWQLLADAGVFRSSFNASGSVMAFNEGARSQGLKLLAEIMEHAPDAFTLMQKEAKADE